MFPYARPFFRHRQPCKACYPCLCASCRNPSRESCRRGVSLTSFFSCTAFLDHPSYQLVDVLSPVSKSAALRVALLYSPDFKTADWRVQPEKLLQTGNIAQLFLVSKQFICEIFKCN